MGTETLRANGAVAKSIVKWFVAWPRLPSQPRATDCRRASSYQSKRPSPRSTALFGDATAQTARADAFSSLLGEIHELQRCREERYPSFGKVRGLGGAAASRLRRHHHVHPARASMDVRLPRTHRVLSNAVYRRRFQNQLQLRCSIHRPPGLGRCGRPLSR